MLALAALRGDFDDYREDSRDKRWETSKASATSVAGMIDAMDRRSDRVGQAGDASRTAAGEKAAIQAQTQLSGEIFAELQALHFTLSNKERRETTQAMAQLDEENLIAAQSRAFNASGAGTPAPATGTAVPPR